MTNNNDHMVYFDPCDNDYQGPVLILREVATSLEINHRTLRDCAVRGRVGRDGQRHYLPICRLPGGLGTCQGAYEEFLRSLNS
jgi:hypothetical protein